MMVSKKICLLLFVFVNSFVLAQHVDKDVVAFQMNSCVMSITNLNQSQSLTTYDRELDYLQNNISREGLVRIPEVTKLREDIQGAIYQFKITQEERQVLARIRTMEKNGAKWQAISGALSSAMVFIPGKGGAGPQAAFYALATVARSAVEYGAIQNAGSIEEERALWEIRKKDLQQYASLNTNAYSKINEIFRKYHLGDEYELTPERAASFIKNIRETNPSKRIHWLQDNADRYKYFNDYYYYLGMSYYDVKNYAMADRYFNQYLANEKKAKLFKLDDKTGCIYLAKLDYSKGLTKAQYEEYVKKAIANLPHEAMAYIQGALVYFTYLQSPEKAVDLLRKAMYDDKLADKESIIIALTKWMPKVKKMSVYPELYKVVCSAINENEGYVSINSYLAFLNASGERNIWNEINKLISISGHRDSTDINPSGTYDIHIYKNLYVNTGYVSIFTESIHKDELEVMEKTIGYPEGYSKEKLIKKFDLFKEHEELIVCFFEFDQASKQYYVKKNLTKNDFNQLFKTPQDFEGLEKYATELDLSNDKSDGRKMVRKVVEFCRDHQSETPSHRILVCSNDGKRVKEERSNALYLDNYFASYTPIVDVKLNNLKLNPSTCKKLYYSEVVKKKDGSKYRSRMYKAYSGDYIKVQFLAKKADPIYITYHVVGGKPYVASFQTGNRIRYNVSLRTAKHEYMSPNEQQNKGFVEKATQKGKAVLKKGKSTASSAVKKVKSVVGSAD